MASSRARTTPAGSDQSRPPAPARGIFVTGRLGTAEYRPRMRAAGQPRLSGVAPSAEQLVWSNADSGGRHQVHRRCRAPARRANAVSIADKVYTARVAQPPAVPGSGPRGSIGVMVGRQAAAVATRRSVAGSRELVLGGCVVVGGSSTAWRLLRRCDQLFQHPFHDPLGGVAVAERAVVDLHRGIGVRVGEQPARPSRRFAPATQPTQLTAPASRPLRSARSPRAGRRRAAAATALLPARRPNR